MSMEPNPPNERTVRLNKLHQLSQMGIDSYPARAKSDMTLKSLLDKFEEFVKSKKTITLSHSAVTVFLSNLITALFGTFIILITASIIDEIYYSGIPYYWYEFLGFTILFWLVTLLIEWGIYYMFLKKYNFTKIYLLEISILANSVSYFAISAVLPVWYFLSF